MSQKIPSRLCLFPLVDDLLPGGGWFLISLEAHVSESIALEGQKKVWLIQTEMSGGM
jgi:hypothetical protein